MNAAMMKFQRLRAWIAPAALMILASLGGAPAEADTITFNPFGTGNNANAVSGISLLNYASSSVLAYGLTKPTVGATYPVYYESVLSGAQSGGGNALNVSNAGFDVNGSGNQFTVIAGFTETVSSISTVGGYQVFTFTPVTNQPSFFAMYVKSAGSANPSTGNGSGFSSSNPGDLVLSGTVSGSGFSGGFFANPGTGAFNHSGLATANTTTSTITGTGSTSINVNVAYQNSNYFLTPITQLSFTTTNSLGFDQSAPLTGFYSTTGLAAPDLVYNSTNPPPGTDWNTGTVNSVNGQSTEFQSIAHNGFTVVPEPSSLVSALTAAIALPLVRLYRRRRRLSRSAA